MHSNRVRIGKKKFAWPWNSDFALINNVPFTVPSWIVKELDRNRDVTRTPIGGGGGGGVYSYIHVLPTDLIVDWI